MRDEDKWRAGHLTWHGQGVRKRGYGLVQIKKCSKRRSSEAQALQWRSEDPQTTGALRRTAHRLDVTVQEAHRVNGFNGLQDLLAQPQCGAQRESTPRLAAAQVGQVPALRV